MMNIKTAKYFKAPIDNPKKENTSIIATIDSAEMFVPLDPSNRHYQAIQEWVAEGNKIEKADNV